MAIMRLGFMLRGGQLCRGCSSTRHDPAVIPPKSLLLRNSSSNASDELPEPSSQLSHVDSEGKAHMVDISNKSETLRTATALARIIISEEAFKLVQANQLKKGDVLSVAQLAGIMGAKKTSSLIPLCHPLPLDQVSVQVRPERFPDSKGNPTKLGLSVTCTARTYGRTGVEMEALTGATIAALAAYDMCKAVDKNMIIENVRILEKKGGKSDYSWKDQG